MTLIYLPLKKAITRTRILEWLILLPHLRLQIIELPFKNLTRLLLPLVKHPILLILLGLEVTLPPKSYYSAKLRSENLLSLLVLQIKNSMENLEYEWN